ncbi:hypothetical protein E2562_001003 [Oryza meyeriana var. granulata]|uniref:Gnk2-homologous domain-containing protein n=1 Tax=Oryza meyeriana var. granulata TaxID=110450 RepID=A0A6G1CZ94_9ORYZ|nr:hypothetical protein E2562_001003 [Oryza meyeriana var. granulata]
MPFSSRRLSSHSPRPSRHGLSAAAVSLAPTPPAAPTKPILIALYLRGNASSSLFASGAVGSSPETVYGLLLCRGDVSASDCFDCGTRVGQDVGQVCNRIKDAALVYNQCYARFSDNGDFLTSIYNSGDFSLLISGTNITSPDVAGYDRAVTELLKATVRHAVENSTRLFATGQWLGTDPGFRNIYSMAQCTPEMSSARCRRCLDDLVGRWWKMFPLNGEGARVAGERCSLRSELGRGPFCTGAPMGRLGASSPAPVPPAVVPTITAGKNNSEEQIGKSRAFLRTCQVNPVTSGITASGNR